MTSFTHGSPSSPLSGRRRHRTDIGHGDGRHVDHDGDPDTDAEPSGSTLVRLGWFVLLWVGGVATVTVAGYAIRLAIVP